MSRTSVAGGVLVLGLAGGVTATPTGNLQSSNYLDGAVRAARWLQSASSDGSGAGVADRWGGDLQSPYLGAGAAGRAVFFAELYAQTGDPSFRAAAIAVAREALAGVDSGSAPFGLYGGLSGVAFAVGEVGRVAAAPELRASSRALFRRIAGAATGPDGVRAWGTTYDVIDGWAGIGLSLVYAHEQFDDRRYLEAAILAGDALRAVGHTEPGGAMRWMRGEDMALDLPNFSHGTAGAGYFMARLAAPTGEARFRTAALQAAAYLDRIAERDDGLYLVPYGVPDDGYVTRYDIGWAHGPAGTARLFYALWQLTGDATFRRRVEANARSLIASGVPDESADDDRWTGPFRVDRRFGTSGAAAFLIDWGLLTGNTAYLDVAARVSDALLADGVRTEAGLHWRLPLYGFQGPGDSAVFSGYFYGTAGLGLTLLHQHYAGLDRHPAIRLPDDPFPAERPRDP